MPNKTCQPVNYWRITYLSQADFVKVINIKNRELVVNR